MKHMNFNVLGSQLKACCFDPMTGYMRDGYCRILAQDSGTHVVCAIVTEEFLVHTLGLVDTICRKNENMLRLELQFTDRGVLTLRGSLEGEVTT